MEESFSTIGPVVLMLVGLVETWCRGSITGSVWFFGAGGDFFGILLGVPRVLLVVACWVGIL